MEIDFDKKRILIIATGLGFVILSIIGIYFLFFYSSSNEDNFTQEPIVEESDGQINTGLPTVGLSTGGNETNVNPEEDTTEDTVASVVGSQQQLVTKYIESAVTALDVKNGLGARYYQPSTGFFYKKLSDGTSVPLSDRQFNNVKNVIWSNKDKAVIEYPDGANIVYDFVKQQQYTLPAQLHDFAFNNQADVLAAKVTGPLIEDNWLVTISSDGSDLSYVESMGKNGNKVQTLWSPNGQVVAIFADNNGSDSNKIVPIGLNGENYESFNTIGRGFKGAWVDDGKKMLFTTYSSQINFRNTLWIAEFNEDLSAKRQVNLGLSTYLDKCFIDTDRAYCAVPQSMPEGGGWFPELTKNIADDIYLIDFKTLNVEKILTPVNDGKGVTVSSLQYDQTKNQLLFNDTKTGQVFSINVTK